MQAFIRCVAMLCIPCMFAGCAASEAVRIMYDGTVADLDSYFTSHNLSVNGVDRDEMYFCNDRTYLMRAVSAGSLEMVKYLVEKGADVNATVPVSYPHPGGASSSSTSALSIAAKKGDYNLTRYLLENGANLSLAIVQLRQDPSGKNAIQFLETVGPVDSRMSVKEPLFKRPAHK